jgi:hypothetical protein
MFRKPRAGADSGDLKPFVGRPPSPPGTRMTASKSTKAKAQPRISSFFGKASATNAQKTPRKPNESILKFFQKVDAPAHFERDLFVGVKGDSFETASDGGESRYNEDLTPSKRRRVSERPVESKSAEIKDEVEELGQEIKTESNQDIADGLYLEVTKECNKSGPFAEDSEEEEDDDDGDDGEEEEKKKEKEEASTIVVTNHQHNTVVTMNGMNDSLGSTLEIPTKPPLVRKDTSLAGDDFGDADFDEDFYKNGEEFLERLFMEEQEALERDFENGMDTDIVKELIHATTTTTTTTENSTASCPICNASLDNMSDEVRLQ